MSRNSVTSPWLPYSGMDTGARLRLFCFPYAGGAASIFRSWDASLPGEVAVCGVQLPGRESRICEPPFERIEPLVETLAEGLAPWLEPPFAFFGHSMGALIAFELTRELRRLGLPEPAHLFLSGRRAPHIPDREPPIHHLPRAEFLAELRTLNGTPEELLRNEELMECVLPVLRADFALCERYSFSPGPPLEQPLSVFGGDADPEVELADLSAWSRMTTGACRVRILPGDHFFVHQSGDALLRIVGSVLTDAARAASAGSSHAVA